MGKEYAMYQEGLIKSLLARPEEIPNIVDKIDSDDFENVNLKLVYDAILDIHLEHKPITLSEIALNIGDKGGAIDTGWLFNLENNVGKWVQKASPEVWAKLLKRSSAKNKATTALQNALYNMGQNDQNALDIMNNVSNELVDISVEATEGDTFNINEALDRFEEGTKEILETGGKLATIDSAYPTIDYYTQGWGATQLITIGARTGVGKSVFAINNVMSALEQGKSVLFFSLEMSEREVFSRLIAQNSMIPIQKIEKAEPLNDDEISRQNEALEKLRNTNLVLDTNPNVTVESIKRSAIRQAQSEQGLDFIVIDYLQLIENKGKRSRQEAVADLSRNMKILAKELNVPVMVLVQLNREHRDDEDTTPKIYDIRESGAIAQDSNIVILIDRDTDEDSEVIDPRATFIIAKNRQGESNKFISVRTRLDCSQFIDEGKKGQELLNSMELASEQESDELGGLNYESEAYKQGNEYEDVQLENDDYEILFEDNEDDFMSDYSSEF